MFISADPIFFEMLDLHFQAKKQWEISIEDLEKPTKFQPLYPPNPNFICFWFFFWGGGCFPVWLTNDIQFLYQDVSIFDFSFLFTSFLSNGKQTFKLKWKNK